MTAARTAAETREQLLNQLLSLRLRRARRLPRPAPSRSALNRTDAAGSPGPTVASQTMLNEFQKTEQARGALLTYRGRRLLNAGEPWLLERTGG